MTKILLHVCCAPCVTYPFESLQKEGEIIGFFHNPNIQPLEEYEKRLDEARRFFTEMRAPLIITPYDPESWNEAVKGLENEPEGGKRCHECFRLRLRAAAEEAVKQGCDEFTTTLTVSRHKNSKLIHQIGEEASRGLGVLFRKDDFKKKGGYERGMELSYEWGFYRQNYCGCMYSKKNRA